MPLAIFKFALLSLLLADSLSIAQASKNVKMVLEIFRHGARREMSEMPPPPSVSGLSYPDPQWGLMDLTIVGMREHYNLGRQIKQAYPDIIPSSFDPSKIHLIASSTNRTILSAESQLFGMFDLGSGGKIDFDSKDYYQPPIPGFDIPYADGNSGLPKLFNSIPIKNPSAEHNYIFSAGSVQTCPKFGLTMKDLREKMTEKYENEFNSLYDLLTSSGYDAKTYGKKDKYTYELALNVCDYIISNTWNNPGFSVSKLLLDQCQAFVTFDLFGYFFTDTAQMTFTSKLNEKIIEVFDNYVKGVDKQVSLVMFSGHDTTLTAFLNNFFPENSACILNAYRRGIYGAGDQQYYGRNPISGCIDRVRYTANVIIELYTIDQGSELYVNMKYNNVDIPVKGFEDNDMPLSTFIDILSSRVDSKWEENCGVSQTEALNKNTVNAIWVSSVVLLILLIVLLVVSRNRKPSFTADEYYDKLSA